MVSCNTKPSGPDSHITYSGVNSVTLLTEVRLPWIYTCNAEIRNWPGAFPFDAEMRASHSRVERTPLLSSKPFAGGQKTPEDIDPYCILDIGAKWIEVATLSSIGDQDISAQSQSKIKSSNCGECQYWLQSGCTKPNSAHGILLSMPGSKSKELSCGVKLQ